MKATFYLFIAVAIIAAWVYYPDYQSKLPGNMAELQTDLQKVVKEAKSLADSQQQAPVDARPVIHFVPPDPLPKQDNWTWVTTQGAIYRNVKIVRVEADCVTILDSDGGARIDTSTLPPDIQRQLNYTPAIASEAAEQRSDEMAYTKQKLAVEAAEIKSNELAAAVVLNSGPVNNADPNNVIQFQINDLQHQHDALLADAAAARAKTSDAISYDADADRLQEKADSIQKQIAVLQSQLVSKPAPPPAAADNPVPQSQLPLGK